MIVPCSPSPHLQPLSGQVELSGGYLNVPYPERLIKQFKTHSIVVLVENENSLRQESGRCKFIRVSTHSFIQQIMQHIGYGRLHSVTYRSEI
jgi:hypothetical protein